MTKEKTKDESHDAGALMRERIIKRAAVEFLDGMYGILPTGLKKASSTHVLYKLSNYNALFIEMWKMLLNPCQ